ncbi:hypothetical protein ACOMHN_049617 [Nucella lapillus]
MRKRTNYQSFSSHLIGSQDFKPFNIALMETDCAAIIPRPLPSHVSPPPSIWTNQSPALRSGDRTAAEGVSMLSDRPPLKISETVYPQFCRLQERQNTFHNWPLNQHFPPNDLVMQGFYYAGYADCIRCFYCGVGLKSWAANDDVMTEHIRWRPSCGYLLNTKGRRFVEGILSRSQGERSDDGIPSMADVVVVGGAGGGGGESGVGEDVVRGIEEMGIPRSSVIAAVQHLQQSGVTAMDINTVAETVMQLQSGESTPASHSSHNSHQAAHGQDGVHTDGPCNEDLGERVTEEVERISTENQRLKAVKKCRICHTATIGLIFLPCGHLLTCASCGSHSKQCLACGQNIRATANVYLT